MTIQSSPLAEPSEQPEPAAAPVEDAPAEMDADSIHSGPLAEKPTGMTSHSIHSGPLDVPATKMTPESIHSGPLDVPAKPAPVPPEN